MDYNEYIGVGDEDFATTALSSHQDFDIPTTTYSKHIPKKAKLDISFRLDEVEKKLAKLNNICW